MIEIIVNGDARTLPATQTLEALCEALRLPERGVAIAVNYELVPRTRAAECVLHDRDVVEIVTATAGG